MKANLDLNRLYEVEIVDLTDKGEGIGRIDSLAVFVNGAVPGDRVRISVTTLKKQYAIGNIVDFIETSSMRVEPPCPHFGLCGGCQIQQIDYAKQLEIKRQVVVDALERIGNLHGVKVLETLGMENPTHFRNKSSFPVDAKGQIGFYRKRSHEIVPITSCLIQGKPVDEILTFIRQWISNGGIKPYDEQRHKGILRHVVIRESKDNGKLMVVFVTNTKDRLRELEAFVPSLIEAFPSIVSVHQNINRHKGNRILGYENRLLHGEAQITDKIGPHAFMISPNAFFQVNNVQADRLYGKAIEYAGLSGTETVFDLYCGIGTITQRLAKDAKHVYGIEVVGDAIDNAEENKTLNGLDNITYILGYAEDETEELIQRGIKPDVIVVDPPRKGLETKLVDKIIDLKPPRIVYVSCKPSTLARDLAIFSQHGYEIQEVQPVDMFPHSMHVETVVRLQRQNP